ncbi:DinB family protein [Bacillus mangrovi]|uniref:DinB family protein n=1 Tax=Metabacillus mangrovi TaxID=1491830 RepID=A0A7X2S540_9BACI|nr:DinB family protein [Metabacillus mangrovi]MTH53883.1 DinB family protein [Metabacillus mangrovi]
MQRNERLIELLDSTYDQENWYAPLKDALEGLTPAQASWRPAGESAHSIWETLNHLIYYKERLAAGIEGRVWTRHLSGDENFHLTEPSSDEKEWTKVKSRAEHAHAELRELLTAMPEENLSRNALEKKLLDQMLHEAYHTGQIIQTRKLQGSWPSNR